MSGAGRADSLGPASRDDEGAATEPRMVKWLRLAAAPTFLLMTLMTSVSDGGPAEMVCAAGRGSAMSGMARMYLLMSAFHMAPWLTLVAGRRGRPRWP